MPEAGFGRETVMRTTGITYRQLDYWARTGLLTPSVADARGSGSQRKYAFTDIVQLKAIKNLLDAGVTLPKIRKALDYVRHELRRPLQDVTLVSDGKTIYACTSPNEIVDLLAGGQAVFAIAMGKVYEEMQGTIAEFRRPSTGEEHAEEPPEAHGGRQG